MALNGKAVVDGSAAAVVATSHPRAVSSSAVPKGKAYIFLLDNGICRER